MTAAFVETIVGNFAVAEDGGAITHLFLPGESLPEDAVVQETELLKKARNQLLEYLTGKRQQFSLPLSPSGTAFMRSVWEKMAAIPYGETKTYGQLAADIARPSAARAVGLACNRNPIPVFIPCHRVVGCRGNLTGYRGGLALKSWLLQLEQAD